jgi:hypothetical protein
VDFVQLENTEELKEILDNLSSGNHYKTVVLDTATKLRDMRLGELTGKKEVLIQKGWGAATREQYMQCAFEMKKMLGPLLDLPRTKELNVIIISQEANLTHDDGGAGAGSEILRPNVASAVGKSVADFISAECDYIGQCVIRERTQEKEVTMGSITSKVMERIGVEYAMRVGPHDLYRTKFRRSLEVTSPLPDFLPNPAYDSVVKLIRGEKV